MVGCTIASRPCMICMQYDNYVKLYEHKGGPEEDPADYPADGGDNDDNESSDDDDDDYDVERMRRTKRRRSI
ncbi:hypothetical protein Tco_1523612 [Tanacetum coccineum]